MSLVPYSSRDSREIVLRHDDAIVIRDPLTQQLILRSANSSFSECPACHRPFRSSSPDRQPSPHRPTPFISPEYFRMLHDAHNRRDHERNPPSSPIRRLVEPASSAASTGGSVSDAEFIASAPVPQPGHGIKKEAFSPDYFERFFIEEKELGRGGKGVVLLVRHELDGVSLGQFACKRVPVGDDHTWLEKVLIEVQLLQGLSHPNLVSYRHVWLEDVKLNRFGPSVPCAFILQQYCNSGDLLHYIVGPLPAVQSVKEKRKEQLRRRSKGQSERPDMTTSRRKLAFEEIYSFFKDITSGLAHLHASNYIHRDLKPSNCLLHQDGNEMRCLISDFGEVQPENMVRKSTGSTGTISYCAPEVLKQDQFGHYGNFTTKSDIFSLGMILYFMCFGRLPYKSADSVQEENEDITLLRAEISTWAGFQDERRERPELPGQLYDFLKRMLALDPSERPSANDILTAIRTEKGLENLENPPRARNSSSAGLSGRVLQSLDSPMPPSTPVNEPSKRVRSAAYIEDASVSEPPSPEPNPSSQLMIETNAHSRSQSRSSQHARGHSPLLKTPLLMPPPSTPLTTIKNKISLYTYYTQNWLARNRRSPDPSVKLVIFLTKMWSITKPCSPMVAREIVWWPLLLLSALELVLGSRIGWRETTAFGFVHAVIWGFVRWIAGGLCARGNWGWDGTE